MNPHPDATPAASAAKKQIPISNRLRDLCGSALTLLILLAGCGPETSRMEEDNHRYQHPTTYQRSNQSSAYGVFQPSSPAVTPVLPELRDRKSQGLLTISNGVQFSSSSGWAGSDIEWIPMNRVAIFLDDGTTASHIVAQTLVRDFTKLPYYEQITVYPKGTAPENGARAPDLFLSIRIQEDKTNEEQPEPELIFLAGSGLLSGFDPPYQEGRAPLTNWNAQGEIQPLFKGQDWVHDADAARQVADRISGKLIDFLREKLVSFRENKAVLPSLPESFYPDYQPAPELDFLADLEARRLASLRTLVTPNISWWNFSSELPPAEVFEAISSSLVNQGWKVDRNRPGDTPEDQSFIDLVHADLQASLRIGHQYSQPTEFLYGEEASNTYLAAYRQLLPLDRREALIDRALQDGLDAHGVAALPAFLSYQQDHPSLENAIIQAASEMNPEDYSHAIKYLRQTARNLEAARKLLTMASLKMIALDTPSELKELIEDEIKKLDVGKDFHLTDPMLIPLILEPGEKQAFEILTTESLFPGATIERGAGEPLMILTGNNQLCGLVVYPSRPLLDDSDAPAAKPFILRSFHLDADFDEERQRFSRWNSGDKTLQINREESHELTLKYLEDHEFQVTLLPGGGPVKISVSKRKSGDSN